MTCILAAPGAPDSVGFVAPAAWVQAASCAAILARQRCSPRPSRLGPPDGRRLRGVSSARPCPPPVGLVVPSRRHRSGAAPWPGASST